MAFWFKLLLRLLRASVLVVMVVLAWDFLSLPTSLSEAQFDDRLMRHAEKRSPRVALAELMPGDWELVCDGHGYNESFYLQQYKRTYPAVGDMQDGAWGLVFISSDGSYTKAAGNCLSSVHTCLLRVAIRGHKQCCRFRKPPADAQVSGFMAANIS